MPIEIGVFDRQRAKKYVRTFFETRCIYINNSHVKYYILVNVELFYKGSQAGQSYLLDPQPERPCFRLGSFIIMSEKILWLLKHQVILVRFSLQCFLL